MLYFCKCKKHIEIMANSGLKGLYIITFLKDDSLELLIYSIALYLIQF